MFSLPTPGTLPISVLIVTYNEAHNIEACLHSVSFAKEIIVMDCGSIDQTVSIARKFTPHVIITPDWPGDGPQKKRALEQATQDWILILDADERVSPKLATELAEICGKKPQQSFAGYDIPYQSHYFGYPIRFGDWRGEKHLRLFNKKSGQITPNIVHCQVKLNGSKGQTTGNIIHHPFRSLDTLIHKMNVYSSESAKHKFALNKKASLFTAISHGLWCFIRGYIVKLGFLDGQAGFMLALSNAHGTYYRYIKLMMMSHAKS